MPDPANELAFQSPAGFAGRVALLLPSGDIRLSRWVGGLLEQGHPVEERVEAAVSAPIEAVTDCARAGGLQGGDASEGGQSVQYGFTGTHDNWRYYMPWVWADGGEMFDKDYKTVTLGDPPGLEGIQFLGERCWRAPT